MRWIPIEAYEYALEQLAQKSVFTAFDLAEVYGCTLTYAQQLLNRWRRKGIVKRIGIRPHPPERGWTRAYVLAIPLEEVRQRLLEPVEEPNP